MTPATGSLATANGEGRYGLTRRIVHWTTAALIVAVLVCAWWMMNIDHSFLRARLLALHKSFGLTILALTLFRVVWGLFHRAPPLPGRVGLVERVLAHLTHFCLYVILIAMPVSGYLTSIWGSAPVSYFGLFTLPIGVEPDDELADKAFAFHAVWQWGVYAFVGLHILGALFHWLVRRDGVTARMGLGSPIDRSKSAGRDARY